ncbi:MAG TPA: hypothetical protein VH277_04095 [Gemmatimonadaceae bacterium]|nr:hypothetical protein [Gemmatimonadaceae bacterium]
MSRLTKYVTAGSLAAVSTLAGCYELQPAGSTAPQPGQLIGLDINDAGRTALGGSMGPEIGQIEGRLVQNTAADYLVAVTDVHFLRGGGQVWSGENVHVLNGYVTQIYQRRLSKAKTAALAAVGIGAVAFLATRGLGGLGDATHIPDSQPGDTAHTTRRPVHP